MAEHRIAYFISLDSIHCKKWVNHLSKNNKCIIITYQGMSSIDVDLPELKIYNIFPKKFPVKNFVSRWIALFRISKILKQNKITLIHSMYCYPNSIWAGYFKSYKKIITTRGSDVLLDYKSIKNSDNSSLIYLKNKLEQALRDAVFISSTSLQQKNYLIEQGFDAAKISVIRTGIEPEHFSIKQGPPKTENQFRILSPRSVQNNYNIHHMFLALKHIISLKPDLNISLDQVLFNLNTNYLQSLYKLIEDEDLKNHVHFIQPYDLKSVSTIYSGYDVAIMIPQSDGTPVSALEVMINKKPLIISNLPYDNDLINENYCWFVNPNKVNEIAECILKIITASEKEISIKTEKAYENVLKNANTHNEMQKVLQLYNFVKP